MGETEKRYPPILTSPAGEKKGVDGNSLLGLQLQLLPLFLLLASYSPNTTGEEGAAVVPGRGGAGGRRTRFFFDFSLLGLSGRLETRLLQ